MDHFITYKRFILLRCLEPLYERMCRLDDRQGIVRITVMPQTAEQVGGGIDDVDGDFLNLETVQYLFTGEFTKMARIARFLQGIIDLCGRFCLPFQFFL